MNVEDMLAIQQEIARYSYTFDAGDAEGWASLFTEDGVWEYFEAGASQPTTRLVGRAQLRDFARQRYEARPKGMTSYHHQSGIIFDELTADTARVRAMLVLTTQSAPEPARVYLTGVYEDRWRKTPRGWRLEHRLLHP